MSNSALERFHDWLEEDDGKEESGWIIIVAIFILITVLAPLIAFCERNILSAIQVIILWIVAYFIVEAVYLSSPSPNS